MKKLLAILFFLLPISIISAEQYNNYFETEIEVEDQLLKYHCYKNQSEFDKDFYQFIISNTLYNSETFLKHDYLQFSTFEKNPVLSEDIKELMRDNGFLYTVTSYTVKDNGKFYTVVIINKMFNGKFYIASWQRLNTSFPY